MNPKHLGVVALLAATAFPLTSLASSHREAPFITTRPKVDATDFYMFNSYEPGRTGYVTLIVDIEIEPGVTIGRHTHPGIESAYMLDGGFDLPIEGQPTVAFKPGMGVVVPPNTPHAGGKNGDKKTHIVSTYIVEKGKPLASPA